MTDPEENDPLDEKKKKEVISVYAALIGAVLIGISFVWNLWSAISGDP